MRMSRSFLGWGVFFIALGLVPLSVQLGWIDRSTVADLWRLWPLILVGAGVGLLLSRTRLEALGGIIVAATGGLLLGGLLTAGANLGSICGPGSGGTTVADRSGILEPGAAASMTSVSPAAVQMCRENGIAVIPGACPNQFLKPDFGHAMMRVMFRTIGFHRMN